MEILCARSCFDFVSVSSLASTLTSFHSVSFASRELCRSTAVEGAQTVFYLHINFTFQPGMSRGLKSSSRDCFSNSSGEKFALENLSRFGEVSN